MSIFLKESTVRYKLVFVNMDISRELVQPFIFIKFIPENC